MRSHLSDLCCDEPMPSPRFRGTQAAADEALAEFDVSGYAARRNEVFPIHRRGASGLSPWIRHGLLSLTTVWDSVTGPHRDVEKFRDELRWQEYSRHLYARIGYDTSRPMRCHPQDPHPGVGNRGDPWDRSMLCVHTVLSELEGDGWLVNQTRMWLASQWTVRYGANWRIGEDQFFTHLLDGSRAANRLGWQWTIGAATGKPYGFSRWQVNKRAPGLCERCDRRNQCPIESWPPEASLSPVSEPPGMRSAPDASAGAGPASPLLSGDPAEVWITAESLGDADPALRSHPDLPIIFVFDEPLLGRLQLSGKRLVFLAERLAELGGSRELRLIRGTPTQVLGESPVAVTYTPVPGWRRIVESVGPAAVYPWPWLHRPGTGSVASFSAWRNALR